MFKVKIPKLAPVPSNPYTPLNAGQPIMMFKDTFDHERYEWWKRRVQEAAHFRRKEALMGKGRVGKRPEGTISLSTGGRLPSRQTSPVGLCLRANDEKHRVAQMAVSRSMSGRYFIRFIF